jgi:hypothetical protein
MLAVIHILYVFLTLQLESNSSGTVLKWTDESPSDFWSFILNDPSSFIFSLAAAAGSIATAFALYYIHKQSRFLEYTLPRPWIGITRIAYNSSKNEVMFLITNFGHFPAKVTALISKDSQTQPSRIDIAKGHINQTEITIFPGNEKKHRMPTIGESLPYLGFIIEYTRPIETKKERKERYGIIYQYSSDKNEFATIDEWVE